MRLRDRHVQQRLRPEQSLSKPLRRIPGADPISDTAAKLVINMVNLGSSFGQSQQGKPQATNSSFVDLGAPLLKRFDTLPLPNRNTNAVVYKGLLVVTDGSKIYVFDANPRDRPRWRRQPRRRYSRLLRAGGAATTRYGRVRSLNGPISAPICAEVPNSSFPTDQIMVVDAGGNLVAFNAFPTSGGVLVNSKTGCPDLYSATTAFAHWSGFADWRAKCPDLP